MPPDRMQGEEYNITSVVLLPKTYNLNLNQEEAPDKAKLKPIFKITGPYSSKMSRSRNTRAEESF